MPSTRDDRRALRAYRNSRLYRSFGRILRVYNRRLVGELHARGFDDFTPAFPALLSNLDTEGSHIGALAVRAGVTRQAASQMLREIERCGYAELEDSPHDTRARRVRFTSRGRKLLDTVLELVDRIDEELAAMLPPGELDRVREALFQIAERIDPGGALGDDVPPRTQDARRVRAVKTLALRRKKMSRRGG